ncbi:MAG: amino acid ABC transporter permease [Proteobacteria bacterium]|nr:amino acid ABC transporter permease [Pseudomonadota bacterium]
MRAPPNSTDLPVLLPMARPVRASEIGKVELGRAGLWAMLVVAAIGLIGEARAAPSDPGLLALLWKWAPLIFQGFLFNLLVSFLSMAIGTAAGAVLGLAQVSLLPQVRQASWFATQFFRNAPWLVLLFYCMFLLPFEIRLFDYVIPLPAWFKATIGLALPVMANMAEIVRGGVQSVPAAQLESAEALAFTRRQILWQIILPQCVTRMTPPWMNLYAILTMATPLISIVGVQESMSLTRAALNAEGRIELLVPMYLMLLVWFFLYCYPIARWTIRLERRFAVKI